MSGQVELLQAAALLERAYRLAHVLQGEGLLEIESRQFDSCELSRCLTRPALLFLRPVNCPSRSDFL